jgi:MraZ protein
MLLGEYRHTLDDKNRLAIPSKFRKLLQGGLVLTKGLDECLFLYPKAAWQRLAERIANLPISQSRSRAFARMMLGGAMEETLDGQGRVVIPDYLREYAGLGKGIIVAGLYDRLEVWDAERWQQYKKQTEKESSHIAETLAEMGV